MLRNTFRILLVVLLSALVFALLLQLLFKYSAVFSGSDGQDTLALGVCAIISLVAGTMIAALFRGHSWSRKPVLGIMSVLALAGWAVIQTLEVFEPRPQTPADIAAAVPAPAKPAPPVTTAKIAAQPQVKILPKKKPSPPKAVKKQTLGLLNGANLGVVLQGNVAAPAKVGKIGTATVKNGAVVAGSIVSGGVSDAPKPAVAMALSSNEDPIFPSNPPKASATEVMPNAFFLKAGQRPPTLGQVSEKIQKALDIGGYTQTSFYRFRDDGFAFATKLEKINEDGTPVAEAERWSAASLPRFNISFTDYIKNLFIAKTGYYRIIVFIISDEAFTQSSDETSRDEAEAWVSDGGNILPLDIARSTYTEDHHCTALVYIFEKPEGATTKFAGNWLQGKTHLEKANLWEALSQ